MSKKSSVKKSAAALRRLHDAHTKLAERKKIVKDESYIEESNIMSDQFHVRNK